MKSKIKEIFEELYAVLTKENTRFDDILSAEKFSVSENLTQNEKDVIFSAEKTIGTGKKKAVLVCIDRQDRPTEEKYLYECGFTAAVLAVKSTLEAENINGTVKLLYCRGDNENIRENADAVFTWLPYDGELEVVDFRTLSEFRIMFEFYGIPSHASAAPWNGRSALDAVSLMNIGTEYLREHITRDSKIRYAVKNGGAAANIVPEFASVLYSIAACEENIDKLRERVVSVAKGAELMTGTRMQAEVIQRVRGLCPDAALTELLKKHMPCSQKSSLKSDEYRKIIIESPYLCGDAPAGFLCGGNSAYEAFSIISETIYDVLAN
ncbi:MAG: peptidase dimerization domain-containing protein [Acutalibacteraceae bacterium]